MKKPDNRVNPMTGKRFSWERDQQALKEADGRAAAEAAKAKAKALAAEEAKATRELETSIRLMQRQKIAMDAKTDFMSFVKFTSPDPEAPEDVTRSRYKDAKHHRAIARIIQAIVAGEVDYTFVILTMPPRHGKSELVSRRLPAWYSGLFPDQNIVVATYNDDFAADFGKEVRSIMHLPQFKSVFPGHQLKRGGAASDRLQTSVGGILAFVGRGGSLTGRGAHTLIIDDLIKDDKEAQSQAIRDQAWNWFTKVAMSRRMGRKIVIMTFTRWHADDPIGRLTDPENMYYNEKLASKIKIINIPAIAEDDDALGREIGEPLWPDGPDKFDLDFLEEQKMLDPIGFAALYQQRPSLADGDLYQRETLRFYKPGDLPEDLRIYCASDHAVATGQKNDFTVLLKYGIDRAENVYLLDCFWQKAKSDVVVEAMLAMGSGNLRPLVWFAEKGHISKAIGPFLKKRMAESGVYMNIREIQPANDKVQRAQSMMGRAAMGKLYFPIDAIWTEKAVNQMMAFPSTAHDDFVDVLSIIGLVLQSQFAPGKKNDKKDDGPVFGTLNWVKHADKWREEKRAIKFAGGF